MSLNEGSKSLYFLQSKNDIYKTFYSKQASLLTPNYKQLSYKHAYYIDDSYA